MEFSSRIIILCVGMFVFGFQYIPYFITLSVLVFIFSKDRLNIIKRTFARDFKALIRFCSLKIKMLYFSRSNMTAAKRFQYFTKKHPNKIAFQIDNIKWTYQQLEDFSNQVANYFKSQGYQRNDNVALFMETRPEYVGLWLGLSKIGVVAALINSNLRQGPLSHSISVAKCKGVICDSSLISGLKEVLDKLGGIPVYYFCDNSSKENLELNAIQLKKELSVTSTDPPMKDILEGKFRDKVIYIFTSGTTGLPKAAVISQFRMFMMCFGVKEMLCLKEDDILYDPLPLYHTAGGMIGVGQSLLAGITVCLRTKFSASNFWKDCVKYECTAAQYIGEMCRYLLSTPICEEERKHKVRVMFGNGLRQKLWTTFRERFNIESIGEFYGATEGNTNLINIDNTIGSVGFVPTYASAIYPVELVKVDESTNEPLRDSNGLCIRCKPGEPGVLVGRINNSLNSFSGYADKEASEKKILKNVFQMGDQVFNSGDILMKDKYGYYFFKDRTGDTFRWRGENVATCEVEAVISADVGLKDVVVYGVEIPNVEGRAGMAAIVDQDGTLDLEKLSKALKTNLPVYARPLFLRVLKDVPLTGTYKLKKKDLQDENYNPHIIQDPLFTTDKDGKFISLTETKYNEIISGKVRL